MALGTTVLALLQPLGIQPLPYTPELLSHKVSAAVLLWWGEVRKGQTRLISCWEECDGGYNQVSRRWKLIPKRSPGRRQGRKSQASKVYLALRQKRERHQPHSTRLILLVKKLVTSKATQWRPDAESFPLKINLSKLPLLSDPQFLHFHNREMKVILISVRHCGLS